MYPPEAEASLPYGLIGRFDVSFEGCLECVAADAGLPLALSFQAL